MSLAVFQEPGQSPILRVVPGTLFLQRLYGGGPTMAVFTPLATPYEYRSRSIPVTLAFGIGTGSPKIP